MLRIALLVGLAVVLVCAPGATATCQTIPHPPQTMCQVGNVASCATAIAGSEAGWAEAVAGWATNGCHE